MRALTDDATPQAGPHQAGPHNDPGAERNAVQQPGPIRPANRGTP
jgi:hypothetical protein